MKVGKVESDFSISCKKLVFLKIAKIESCQIWMVWIESDLYISCHKLTVLMN